jgi:type III pantothenate kinase
MLLCLDIGNTHIYAGLFSEEKIKLQFRYPSTQTCTSDTFGVFLRSIFRENEIAIEQVKAVSLASVVPALDYSIIAACKKYFSIDPLVLKAGVKTGLKLDIKNPLELGADRIAKAVAAIETFPNKNIIVVDFGTATTVCAIGKEKVYLGGIIFPGIKLCMESLSQNAAKLKAVDIVSPKKALGKTTETNIQSGLYFGQLGAIKEVIQRFNEEVFSHEPAMTIITGGYASLFKSEKIFDCHLPDLVLHGLRLIHQKNETFKS